MGDLKRQRIVVIEDEPDLRSTLAELLALHGYDVGCAANGMEALKLLSRGPVPDLIFLDLMMPVMDGWHFRSELSRYPGLAQIPVVLLSAMPELSDEAQKLHVVGSLPKPFPLSAVLSIVREHCA
jgi:CheY-like chemotaxis protein